MRHSPSTSSSIKSQFPKMDQVLVSKATCLDEIDHRLNESIAVDCGDDGLKIRVYHPTKKRIEKVKSKETSASGVGGWMEKHLQ